MAPRNLSPGGPARRLVDTRPWTTEQECERAIERVLRSDGWPCVHLPPSLVEASGPLASWRLSEVALSPADTGCMRFCGDRPTALVPIMVRSWHTNRHGDEIPMIHWGFGNGTGTYGARLMVRVSKIERSFECIWAPSWSADRESYRSPWDHLDCDYMLPDGASVRRCSIINGCNDRSASPGRAKDLVDILVCDDGQNNACALYASEAMVADATPSGPMRHWCFFDGVYAPFDPHKVDGWGFVVAHAGRRRLVIGSGDTMFSYGHFDRDRFSLLPDTDGKQHAGVLFLDVLDDARNGPLSLYVDCEALDPRRICSAPMPHRDGVVYVAGTDLETVDRYHASDDVIVPAPGSSVRILRVSKCNADPDPDAWYPTLAHVTLGPRLPALCCRWRGPGLSPSFVGPIFGAADGDERVEHDLGDDAVHDCDDVTSTGISIEPLEPLDPQEAAAAALLWAWRVRHAEGAKARTYERMLVPDARQVYLERVGRLLAGPMFRFRVGGRPLAEPITIDWAKGAVRRMAFQDLFPVWDGPPDLDTGHPSLPPSPRDAPDDGTNGDAMHHDDESAHDPFA